jgi:mannitol-1-phosphate/altronate dehydrogenase
MEAAKMGMRKIECRIIELTAEYGKRVGEVTPTVTLAAKAAAIAEYARRGHKRGSVTRQTLDLAEAKAAEALRKMVGKA